MATIIDKSGTVRGVAKSNKWFCLSEDGEESSGYSVFREEQMGGLERGDTIEFRFKEKESRGKTYNNVVGTVNVTSKGSGGEAPHSLPEPKGVFGTMSLSKDRSIARQNACNVIAQIIYDGSLGESGDGIAEMSPSDIAEEIVEAAKIIEAYTTGDSDKEEAAKALEDEVAVAYSVESEDKERFEELVNEANAAA